MAAFNYVRGNERQGTRETKRGREEKITNEGLRERTEAESVHVQECVLVVLFMYSDVCSSQNKEKKEKSSLFHGKSRPLLRLRKCVCAHACSGPACLCCVLKSSSTRHLLLIYYSSRISHESNRKRQTQIITPYPAHTHHVTVPGNLCP